MPTIHGSIHDDLIDGTIETDEIFGYGGRDQIRGHVGDDVLHGQEGDDILQGGDGVDTLNGGDGNDDLYGYDVREERPDYLNGGAGDDLLITHGFDHLNGGDGIDRVQIGVPWQFTSETAPALHFDLTSFWTDPQNALLQFGGTMTSVESAYFGGGFANDTGIGWDYSDFLRGDQGDDLLEGRGGDDTLWGEIGNDVLMGGAGNDYIDGGWGADIMHGGDGDDEIHDDDKGSSGEAYGGAGNDRISLGAERYAQVAKDILIVIDGGEGNDILGAGSGEISRVTSRVTAGAGDDQVSLGCGYDAEADLGDGNDLLRLGRGESDIATRVTLGAGQDTIMGLNGRADGQTEIRILDFATGQNGDIVDYSLYSPLQLIGWNYENPFSTGYLQLVQRGDDAVLQIRLDPQDDAWSDVLTFVGRSSASFTATNFRGWDPSGRGAQSIDWTGSDASEIYHGMLGDDRLDGSGGHDELWGSLGDDLLIGGDGNDVLFGGGGDDILVGGAGADIFQGHDLYTPNSGGLDLVDYGASDAGVRAGLNGGYGIGGHAEGDIFNGEIDGFLGSAFNDALTGSAFGSVLEGRDGNDVLQGFDADDRLIGGDGNDVLMGGRGVDFLDGGRGVDSATMTGNWSDYRFFSLDGGIYLKSATHAAHLHDIEFIVFNDRTIETGLIIDAFDPGSKSDPSGPLILPQSDSVEPRASALADEGSVMPDLMTYASTARLAVGHVVTSSDWFVLL